MATKNSVIVHRCVQNDERIIFRITFLTILQEIRLRFQYDECFFINYYQNVRKPSTTNIENHNVHRTKLVDG